MALFSVFILIIIIVLLFLIFRARLIIKWDRSYTCLVGKTAIVTGANTGIGYYTALDFAKRGGRVILACRSKNRGEEARERIVRITGNPHITVKLFDASSFDSIRAFAKDFNETEARLDILVNNAGVNFAGQQWSKDGNDLIMQVNYYSGFLLTHLLFEKLRASIPSRIINVSSKAHIHANLDPTNLNKHVKLPPWLPDFGLYSNSKLGNICFTMELARRLEGTGITTNSLHPGVVITDIWRHSNSRIRFFYNIFSPLFFRTSEEGAQTTIYLSVSPDVRNVSGKYFDNCSPKNTQLSINNFKDAKFLREVWTATEKLVKLTPEEKIYAPIINSF